MTDTNTFNYQDYVQGQTINLGTNQVISSNTQIDPSTYIQGDTAVLQASAGLEEALISATISSIIEYALIRPSTIFFRARALSKSY